MDLSDLLEGRGVELRAAASKAQALAVLADVGARRMEVDPEVVLQALTAREAVGSTGVGNGVALPHARIPGLDRTRGVFVRLDQPVPYDAVDDQPVDLLFGLFAPMNAGAEHLQALARVSRRLRDPRLRRQLRTAASTDALFCLLTHEARPTAA